MNVHEGCDEDAVVYGSGLAGPARRTLSGRSLGGALRRGAAAWV